MLLRWLQFGAVSPIFRTHCETPCDRYVWHFPHFEQMRAAMLLRDALVPYIYTAGLEAYQTGISLLRPMYYRWPEEEASYAHTGQYMFGPDVLAAPVSNKSDADGRAAKAVWLPPIGGKDSSAGFPALWMQWNGTSAPAKPGEVLSARWSSDEIPLFVQAGTVIPLRTLASTHTAFVNPVVWAAWVSTAGTFFTARLFEDAGDGLEYKSLRGELNSDTSALTEGVLEVAANSTLLSFKVEPTRGHYKGQGEARSHFVQCRGISRAPNSVHINGLEVHQVQPGSDAPGWYISVGSADGRDRFTEPAAMLVIVTGRQDIRKLVDVKVLLQPEKFASAMTEVLI